MYGTAVYLSTRTMNETHTHQSKKLPKKLASQQTRCMLGGMAMAPPDQPQRACQPKLRTHMKSKNNLACIHACKHPHAQTIDLRAFTVANVPAYNDILFGYANPAEDYTEDAVVTSILADEKDH